MICNHRATEHGIIMVLMSCTPKTAYQQGIERKWKRFDKFDYYWPEFAQLGEQEVKNHEIYYNGAANNNPDATFGYQERYAEYKYGRSSVHGDYKDSMSYAHLGRIFSSEPGLNEGFMQVKSGETDRIFAVQEGGTNSLWAQLAHNISAIRPMPRLYRPRL